MYSQHYIFLTVAGYYNVQTYSKIFNQTSLSLLLGER